MDEPVDDGFTYDGVFEQLEPTLGLDLGGDDERGLVVALFENIDQGSRFVVGVVSQAEIVEDQDFGLDQRAHVVEIAARGLGGLDFFEQEAGRQEHRRVALLAEPLAQSGGEKGFAQAGFADDQKIFQVMEKGQL